MPKARARSKTTRRWRPSPPALVGDFLAAIEFIDDAERKKMFGYPAAFVNGRLFASLYQDRMVLKLSPQEKSRFLKLPGAAPFEPIPGRTMGTFVLVPRRMAPSAAGLRPWLKRAHAYVKALPAKPAKRRK